MQSAIDQPTDLPGFTPRQWLRHGHAQTLAGNFLPRENGLPAAVARVIPVSDDSKVLCHCHWQPEKRRRQALTLIVVHGLEGSSDSQYVIGTGTKAWREGMNVVRMNMRNCGGTETLTPTLYHSGMSQDVEAVVRHLVESDGLERIVLVGFSMGGNLVLKLVGENGSNLPSQIKAVAGVSPAMDLSISADALHRPANRMYEWKFIHGLRRRFRRKADLFPDLYDLRYLSGVRTIREFDNEITARYSGFQGAEDYYTRSSASGYCEGISIPALVIHSADDPFIILREETRAKLRSNHHVRFLETSHGGHCAFLAPANGYDGRWAEQASVRFLLENS